MPSKKEPELYAPKGRKMIWHPCHLQSMNHRKFIEVANLALSGQFRFLPIRSEKQVVK